MEVLAIEKVQNKFTKMIPGMEGQVQSQYLQSIWKGTLTGVEWRNENEPNAENWTSKDRHIIWHGLCQKLNNGLKLM